MVGTSLTLGKKYMIGKNGKKQRNAHAPQLTLRLELSVALRAPMESATGRRFHGKESSTLDSIRELGW